MAWCRVRAGGLLRGREEAARHPRQVPRAQEPAGARAGAGGALHPPARGVVAQAAEGCQGARGRFKRAHPGRGPATPSRAVSCRLVPRLPTSLSPLRSPRGCRAARPSPASNCSCPSLCSRHQVVSLYEAIEIADDQVPHTTHTPMISSMIARMHSMPPPRISPVHHARTTHAPLQAPSVHCPSARPITRCSTPPAPRT